MKAEKYNKIGRMLLMLMTISGVGFIFVTLTSNVSGSTTNRFVVTAIVSMLILTSVCLYNLGKKKASS